LKELQKKQRKFIKGFSCFFYKILSVNLY